MLGGEGCGEGGSDHTSGNVSVAYVIVTYELLSDTYLSISMCYYNVSL